MAVCTKLRKSTPVQESETYVRPPVSLVPRKPKHKAEHVKESVPLLLRVIAVIAFIAGVAVIYYGLAGTVYKAYGFIFAMLGTTLSLSAIEIWFGKDFSDT